jgi:hypothetical protein
MHFVKTGGNREVKYSFGIHGMNSLLAHSAIYRGKAVSVMGKQNG